MVLSYWRTHFETILGIMLEDKIWPQTLRYIVTKVHSFKVGFSPYIPLHLYLHYQFHKLYLSKSVSFIISLTCLIWSICPSKECTEDPYHLGLQFNVASLPPRNTCSSEGLMETGTLPHNHACFSPTEPCLPSLLVRFWGSN